jgi:hypothetical protein
MKWKFWNKIHMGKSKREDSDKKTIESDQFYEYFEYELFTYFLDKETQELFEIQKDSFNKICNTTNYSEVLESGVQISDKIALEKSNFNYIPAHIDEWTPSDIIYLDYESTIYVYDRESMELFEIRPGSERIRVESPSKFARVTCNGSVINR